MARRSADSICFGAAGTESADSWPAEARAGRLRCRTPVWRRRGERSHLERIVDLPPDSLRGGLGIENHPPAEEIVRIEAPEREIRVGDGGLRAAAAIADRPRLGACALRADLQGADIVDPGDAA